MRAGVINDEVDVQLSRDRGVDRHQEPATFSGAVALMELADDFATPGILRGEERGRPMPRVVVGPALDLPGRIGNTGCVRSSAWIWDFSSTQRTNALSGGSR
jgi:hypothetical protein